MSCLNVNKVILAGRVASDCELKTTTSGISVCSISMAINRFARQGEEAKADFIKVIAFKDRAEFLSKYFRKGSAIYVEGTLQQRTWTDNGGQNKSVLEVIANDVRFIDSKKDQNANADVNVPYSESQQDFTDLGTADDDDLPF